jgi:hypothetical protein
MLAVTDSTRSIVELLVGLGLLGGMWKIASTLSAIKTALCGLTKDFDETRHDHESRLRRLEHTPCAPSPANG